MPGLGKWALLSLSIGTVAGLPPRRDDAQTFAGRAGVADRSSIVDMLELAGEGFASQARGPSPGFVAAPDPQWDGMRARHDPAFEPRADNSPIPSASFLAVDGAPGVGPPGVGGAAGPGHLMAVVGDTVRVQSRTGSVLSTVPQESFWSGVSYPGERLSTEFPNVLFDRQSGRWMYIGIARYSGLSYLLVAISQTDDPTGKWFLYRVELGYKDFFLEPRLGVNSNWIVVSVNRQNFNINLVDALVFAFNKTSLGAGGLGSFTSWTVRTGGAVTQATICPAQTLDDTPTMFLVQNGSPASGQLRVSTITGAVGAEILTFGVAFPTSSIPWASEAPGGVDLAPQAGSSAKFGTRDANIRSVVCRNGALWAAHTVFYPAAVPTRSSIQVWELDITSPGLPVKQRLSVDDPAGLQFHAFPSVAVNKNNDLLVGYSRFSANSFASACYSVRSSGDTANTLQSSQVLKAGEASYYYPGPALSNPWNNGTTTVDAGNDTGFWTLQLYAAFSSGSDRWGTWWGNVMPNVAPAASWAITMGKSIYVTGDTITATEFGPRTGGASVVVRLQITMTVPTLGTLSVIDIGADSSFTLPANTRVNFGPLPLITVNSTFPPRGQWSLDSKVTNPTTGALIDQDLNPFVIQ